MNNQNDYQNNRYNNLKCVWMASRIVDYKLCDKEFDCENCPFDKDVRNSSADNEMLDINKNNILASLNDRLQNIKYDEKIIYLKNGLMVKQIFGNTYYIGLNPILQLFLEGIKYIKQCDLGKYILKGNPVLQFRGDWGAMTINSPLNFLMYDIMNIYTGELIKNKWFAIIGIIQPEISLGIITRKDWDDALYKSFEFVETMKTTHSAVGTTMHDGGHQIKYLYQLVGKTKYMEILNAILGA